MTSIQGIYIALFGRPADPEGLKYWTEQTKDGADLSFLIGRLTEADEYKNLVANKTPTEVINAIYQHLFDRDADAKGLEHYLKLLESGEQSIETIAIDILSGAIGSDVALIEAKIAAADLFTAQLNLDVEVEAYSGTTAESVGRDFINAVNETTDGVSTLADEYIRKLLPDEGQGPGEQPGDGGSNGGNSSKLTVKVIEGELQFGGSATGDIEVSINTDGELVFERGGRTAVLNSSATITSIQAGVNLISTQDGSDVLAYGEDGWFFVEGGNVAGVHADGLDFYKAINLSGNVILLDGFDVSDFANDEIPWSLVLQSLGGLAQDPQALLNALDFLVHAGAANTDIAVAATDAANTSLNVAINDIIDDLSGGDFELPSEFPIIGMPIMLEGEGSNVLAASGDSDSGYILVGNIDSVHDAISALVEGDYDAAYAALQDASDDTITGSAGDDIILGLGDNGGWIFDEADILFAQDEDTDQFLGDVLTGGDGNDIFVHLDIAGIYNDGVDWITDFGVGGTDLLVFTAMDPASIIYEVLDADGDGLDDDTVFTFGGDSAEGNSAVVLLDFTGGAPAGELDVGPIGVYMFSSANIEYQAV